MEKVDILLPTYNGEKFIIPQIKSLLDQSYKNIQILIRDDNSSDNTLQLVKELAAKEDRITVFDSGGKNIGLVSGIEFLLAKSNSEFIMLCDQDDIWLYDKIEIMIAEMKTMQEEYGANLPLLVHSNCFVTDENLDVKKAFLGRKPQSQGLNNCLFHYFVQGASTLFNSALKKQLIPFVPEIYIHDRYIHLVCEIVGKRSYVAKPLMLYRQHSSNLIGSNTVLKKIANQFKNPTYYLPKDRLLIESLYLNKFPQKSILKDYLKITSNNIGLVHKLKLLIYNRISLRLKEWILLFTKG